MTDAVTERKHSGLLQWFGNQYHMTASEVGSTLMGTIMPNKKATVAQVHALLIVAKEHGLNPFTKEIYAFPDRGGAIKPIVGVDGWLKLANNHPQFDGMDTEFGYSEEFSDTYCTVSVYRKDRRMPMKHTAWLKENRRNTDPWNNMTKRMLEHRATCQAIRRAFSFSGIMEPDEALAAQDWEEEKKQPGDIDVEATTTKPKDAQDAVSRMADKLGSNPLDLEQHTDEQPGKAATFPTTDEDIDPDYEQEWKYDDVDPDVPVPADGWPFPMPIDLPWAKLMGREIGGTSRMKAHTWVEMTLGAPDGGRRKFMQSVVTKAANQWDLNHTEPSSYAAMCAKALAVGARRDEGLRDETQPDPHEQLDEPEDRPERIPDWGESEDLCEDTGDDPG